MVRVLAFYFYNPSLNPAKSYSFFCKNLCLKTKKINKKRPGLAHSKNRGDSERGHAENVKLEVTGSSLMKKSSLAAG